MDIGAFAHSVGTVVVFRFKIRQPFLCAKVEQEFIGAAYVF